MIRLVLSDIDGTLLPFHQWHIDDETKGAIRDLEKAGIAFGPASGRPIADINKAFDDPGFSATCVASDGMVARFDGTLACDISLPNASLQRIADVMRDTQNAALAVCFNEEDDPTLPMTWATVAISEHGKEIILPHIKYLPYVPNFDNVPKHKICVSGMLGPLDDAAQTEIERIVSSNTDDLHTLRTAPGYYDVCLRTWDKAKGAAELIGAMGIGADEVVFFGDSFNDCPLFDLFPNSFCVASGATVAKDAAKWVIPDPQDGGPVAAMQALAKTKGDLEATLTLLGL